MAGIFCVEATFFEEKTCPKWCKVSFISEIFVGSEVTQVSIAAVPKTLALQRGVGSLRKGPTEHQSFQRPVKTRGDGMSLTSSVFFRDTYLGVCMQLHSIIPCNTKPLHEKRCIKNNPHPLAVLEVL